VHEKDFLNVINTCPEWNKILSSRKTMELYGLALPLVMEWLPKNDFLNLRSVSRGWKEGLDMVYENHSARLASVTSDIRFPTLVLNEESEEPARIILLVDNGMVFGQLDQIQGFLGETGVNSGNPFPGRCVKFSLHSSELVGRAELLQSFTQLLIRFGEHIWYLRLNLACDQDPMHSTELETQLMDWLTRVPNLKRLQLEFGLAPDGDDCDGLNEDYWRQNPVPKLTNLEVFSLTNDEDYSVHTPLIHQVLECFCADGNLKRLRIPDNGYGPDFPLPNLVELAATILYEDLPLLQISSPNLEKLVLTIEGITAERGGLGRYTYNIVTVFGALNMFADSLKELELLDNPPDKYVFPKNGEFNLEFPKLEKLVLKIEQESDVEGFTSQVLERMPNVKTLVISGK